MSQQAMKTADEYREEVERAGTWHGLFLIANELCDALDAESKQLQVRKEAFFQLVDMRDAIATKARALVEALPRCGACGGPATRSGYDQYEDNAEVLRCETCCFPSVNPYQTEYPCGLHYLPYAFALRELVEVLR
jgi:hypothetical protein